ncbi:Putative galactoside O-acetyltransferase [Limosilactobacillus gastricus PS3]|uniref:Putative galactoside O-acetyltransferase n=1 Tax=Limosilactobacillus gastricus PS3 TaxID=1144300 RepID=H4GJW6_9LACO|nr:sugar O-acetyltransferase [Limosilactobacillus gastricus]EHS86040.1 Putative galactoside O-acetyltransferase [Limosilactobacillus gastricus PS3]
MDIFERFRNGEIIDLRDPQYVKEALTEMQRCRHLCWKINQTDPDKVNQITTLEKELVINQRDNCFITPPFQIDMGCCLHLGKNVFINSGLTMMSIGSIFIDDGTMIGPDVGFFTTNHDPHDVGKMSTKEIHIGKNVWIGARVNILPGVTIGDGAVIGTGTVVTKDIPAHSIAVGNPARVIKTIE